MIDLMKTILIMTLTGSIMSLILFAIKPLVRDRLPKSTQYYLWLVVIAALFIPVSRIVVLPESNPMSVASVHAVVEQIAIPYTPAVPQTVSETLLDSPLADSMPYMLPQDKKAIPVEIVIMLTYLFGVLTTSAYFLINYNYFIRMHNIRNREAKSMEIELLADLFVGHRIPRLFRNPLASTPMLIGFFVPSIIIPDREYTEAQLHYVLLHEITHLRRKDVLIKWLTMAACAIHWFNPLMWFIRREIDHVCELSCDEAVINNLDAKGRQDYGDTLIHVAADTKFPKIILSTTMCEEKKALKERLGAIMKNKKKSSIAVFVSLLMMIMAIGTVVVLGAGGNTNFEPGLPGSANKQISIKEIAKSYYLENATVRDKLEQLHSVTLYEDGSANLATPPISSYLLPECIASIADDELRILAVIGSRWEEGFYGVKNNDIIAVFTIIDEDTLVFKSASVPVFAVTGARYSSNTSVAISSSGYQPRKWIDFYGGDNMLWDESITIVLDQFPDITFQWTWEFLTAITPAGEKQLFTGWPIWNVFFADLNGDGFPEICATISMGSGIVDTHVVVYDYASDKMYILEDRMYYDYYLSLVDGRLVVTQTEYNSNMVRATGGIAIINDNLVVNGIDRTKQLPEQQKTSPPNYSDPQKEEANTISTVPPTHVPQLSINNAPADLPAGTEEADARAIEIMEKSGTWGTEMDRLIPQMSSAAVDKAVSIYLDKQLFPGITTPTSARTTASRVEAALTYMTADGRKAAEERLNAFIGTSDANPPLRSKVIELNNGSSSSITKSGSFDAENNQTLVLKITSTIVGGTVDLFLFDPNGNEQCITIGNMDDTKEIKLSRGRWAYNCTGFFTSGDITIIGSLK